MVQSRRRFPLQNSRDDGRDSGDTSYRLIREQILEYPSFQRSFLWTLFSLPRRWQIVSALNRSNYGETREISSVRSTPFLERKLSSTFYPSPSPPFRFSSRHYSPLYIYATNESCFVV